MWSLAILHQGSRQEVAVLLSWTQSGANSSPPLSLPSSPEYLCGPWAVLLHPHCCSLGNGGTQPSLFLLCGIQHWCHLLELLGKLMEVAVVWQAGSCLSAREPNKGNSGWKETCRAKPRTDQCLIGLLQEGELLSPCFWCVIYLCRQQWLLLCLPMECDWWKLQKYHSHLINTSCHHYLISEMTQTHP